jgi:2-oxoglutarate ferredoxin oxidoreductase subunit gamma
MRTTDVLMAGFGGQGMLLAGKILAHAAMAEGRQVSWLPSYGPEMRGGTANVIVCISEQPIASPLVASPHALLAMNLPSMEKFAPRVRKGGVIVLNTSLIDREAGRPDCRVFHVDSRNLAREAGSDRAANFVMLGTYAAATRVVEQGSLEAEIAHEFTGGKERFVPANMAAFRAGWALGASAEEAADSPTATEGGAR